MMVRNRVFKTALIFIFFTFSLNADFLTQYRMKGIKDLEKQLDSDLANHEYWDGFLKNIDTTFGYLESYPNVLACDKSHSTLTLYRKDSDNIYKTTKMYNAFTGKIQGDKIKEGDLKTPIGAYTLVKKLSKVDSFYGPMAFVTSYPNIYDKYRNKGGSGIWIHGLPTDQSRDSFTKGCIAINNQNIECLDKNINIKETLLLIYADKTKPNISKDTLSNVLSQLFTWRYTWKYNDVNAYLDFYDIEFKRFDNLNYFDFTHYKRRIFKKQEDKNIIFTNINVIPYPGSDNTFKITFFEKYTSNNFSFNGNKILIVKMKNGKMKILTEQ